MLIGKRSSWPSRLPQRHTMRNIAGGAKCESTSCTSTKAISKPNPMTLVSSRTIKFTAETGGNWRADAPRYKGRHTPAMAAGRQQRRSRRGFGFTVPDVDVAADFHGSISDPRPALYVCGNYFFAMALRPHPSCLRSMWIPQLLLFYLHGCP
jgi:hypothetical protein